MEYISDETVRCLIEELEDDVTRLQDCIETLKAGKELDDTQIAYLKASNIEI